MSIGTFIISGILVIFGFLLTKVISMTSNNSHEILFLAFISFIILDEIFQIKEK